MNELNEWICTDLTPSSRWRAAIGRTKIRIAYSHLFSSCRNCWIAAQQNWIRSPQKNEKMLETKTEKRIEKETKDETNADNVVTHTHHILPLILFAFWKILKIPTTTSTSSSSSSSNVQWSPTSQPTDWCCYCWVFIIFLSLDACLSQRSEASDLRINHFILFRVSSGTICLHIGRVFLLCFVWISLFSVKNEQKENRVSVDSATGCGKNIWCKIL